MYAMRIVGVLLLVAGLAAFTTGGLRFTMDAAPPDPLELAVKETQSVPVPQWISLGAMVVGGAVLVLGFRRR